jgi:hypothetical protein
MVIHSIKNSMENFWVIHAVTNKVLEKFLWKTCGDFPKFQALPKSKIQGILAQHNNLFLFSFCCNFFSIQSKQAFNNNLTLCG